MSDEARQPVTIELFHDFDQRWRAVLQDADSEEIETIVLPPETDGVRSAVRQLRLKLRGRMLDVGALAPTDETNSIWRGTVQAALPVA